MDPCPEKCRVCGSSAYIGLQTTLCTNMFCQNYSAAVSREKDEYIDSLISKYDSPVVTDDLKEETTQPFIRPRDPFDW